MGKLQDLLKEKGFDETNIENIVECINKSEMYIPKSRFEEVNTEKNNFKQQIETYNTQIKELQKSVGDNEELKKAIDKYKNDIKDINAKHEAEMKEFIRDNAIKSKFADKVNDADYVLSKLDKTKIFYDENTKNVVGLDEQLEQLRQNYSWVFKNENPSISGGYNPQQGSNGKQKKEEDGGESEDLAMSLIMSAFPQKKGE